MIAATIWNLSLLALLQIVNANPVVIYRTSAAAPQTRTLLHPIHRTKETNIPYITTTTTTQETLTEIVVPSTTPLTEILVTGTETVTSTEAATEIVSTSTIPLYLSTVGTRTVTSYAATKTPLSFVTMTPYVTSTPPASTVYLASIVTAAPVTIAPRGTTIIPTHSLTHTLQTVISTYETVQMSQLLSTAIETEHTQMLSTMTLGQRATDITTVTGKPTFFTIMPTSM